MTSVDSSSVHGGDDVRQALADYFLVEEEVCREGMCREKPVNEDLARSIVDTSREHVDFLESPLADKYGLGGKIISRVVLPWLIKRHVYVYGNAALNQLLGDEHRIVKSHIHMADFQALSTRARSDAEDLSRTLHLGGYGHVDVRGSALHPDVYVVSVMGCALVDLRQTSQLLINAIDTYRGDDGVMYCGPLWLRMNLYQQLASTGHKEDALSPEWLSARDTLQNLNHDAPIAPYDLKEYRVWGDDEMYEEEYETFIHNDALHQDLYRGMLEFVAKRQLTLFGLSTEGWFVSTAGLAGDVPVAAPHTTFIRTRSRVDESEFDVLSVSARQDAEELAQIMRQFLYQDDLSIKFEVVEKPPTWMFSNPSYAVVMTEEIRDKADGSVRALTDTLIEFYEPSEQQCFSYQMVGDLRVASASTLISLLLMQYFSTPRVHFRNRVSHLAERLIDAIHSHPEQLYQGKFVQLECYGHSQGASAPQNARSRIVSRIHAKKVADAEKASQFSFKPSQA